MRITKLHPLLAPLSALLFAGLGCQTARVSKPMLPSAQATAPVVVAQVAPATPTPVPAKTSESQPEVHTAPMLDVAADLITQVDKEYQAGQNDYKTGNLQAARQHFEQAVELLTLSPLDVKSDVRLQNKLDLVLAAVERLGGSGEEQAETTPDTQTEPAPIDEASEAAAPADASSLARAEGEARNTRSDLPLMMNQEVAGYISYFSGRGRDILENGLVRSGRYRDMIQTVFKEEGVPQDLIYLAQAESGFHPWAISRVGARGMWQFMGSRARGYGLKKTLWVDERQDPEMATRAAARHLKDLYHQFGDWYLAMAAYNSGPGNVQGAVKRTGYADFWELYRRNALPKETRNYVPIILAVTIMAKNPEEYGLTDLVMDKPAPTTTVKIDYPVDLRLVAQCIDVSPYALQELNPQLLRWTTPSEGGFSLRLPDGSEEQYQNAISLIPKEKRLSWRYHKVVPGDTLTSIARAYGSTSKSIALQNELDAGENLAAGAHLVVPVVPGKHATDSQTYARRVTRYRVHRGDSVQSVAQNFNVPPLMIRRWNHLRGNSLGGRRILYLHLPVSPATVEARRKAQTQPKKEISKATPAPVVHYEVKKGETLYSIASAHHTTVDAITRDNGDLSILRPGMVLLIRGIK